MKKEATARVGTIISCHDDASYLRRALDSIRLSSVGYETRIVVIMHRCTYKCHEVVRSFGVEMIVNDHPWLSSPVWQSEIKKFLEWQKTAEKKASKLPRESVYLENLCPSTEGERH